MATILLKKYIKEIIYKLRMITEKYKSMAQIVQLLVWVICDGTIVDHSKYKSNSTKKRIQWKLSKQRKIIKLKELLDNMGMKYTLRKATMSPTNILQPYYIRIYGDDARQIFLWLGGKKHFPHSLLKKDDVIVENLIKTLEITDGNRVNRRIVWRTVELLDFQWVLDFCSLNNLTYSLHKSKDNITSLGKNPKTIHTVSIRYD